MQTSAVAANAVLRKRPAPKPCELERLIHVPCWIGWLVVMVLGLAVLAGHRYAPVSAEEGWNQRN